MAAAGKGHPRVLVVDEASDDLKDPPRGRLQRALDEHWQLQRVRREAARDAHTGLPTPRLFRERLVRMVEGGLRRPYFSAVFLVDLPELRLLAMDRPAAALRLAAAAGRRILGALREADTVTRLETGEFAVLLDEIVSPTVAELVARRLCARLRQALGGSGASAPARIADVRLGYAVYPEDARAPDALMGLADAALGRARRERPNTCLRARQAPRPARWAAMPRLFSR